MPRHGAGGAVVVRHGAGRGEGGRGGVRAEAGVCAGWRADVGDAPVEAGRRGDGKVDEPLLSSSIEFIF